MNLPDRVVLKQLATGVRGLDQVLGGGLPEYSFNLVGGEAGTGKTTLGQQLMFGMSTPSRPALHFTVVGESSLKLLRHQQQFSFFDSARVGTSVCYVNLTHAVLERGLEAVLDAMVEHIERLSPGVVVVDSFGALVQSARVEAESAIELQGFLERLAIHLTIWGATSVLIGNYAALGRAENALFSVADGILWLHQGLDSSERKLRVSKMRGQAQLPGLHGVRITEDGLEVFPQPQSGHGYCRAARPD